MSSSGPMMKLCLWDKAATDFCEKFKAHGNTPRVILVTTLNPKRIGGFNNQNFLMAINGISISIRE